MPSGEYLLCRENSALPPGATLSETLYGSLSVGVVLRRSGNQIRNQFAVPGYGNGFSVLDYTEEFRPVPLGYGGFNLTHI